MNIPVQDARGLFTKKLVDVYQERKRPTLALSSFFPSAGRPVSKNVSIEVERTFEYVATDVLRGTEGNRNRFSDSTEKIYTPPLYREYIDATELDLYDRVLGSQTDTNDDLFMQLLNTVADRMGMLQDKIERAREIQIAQVFDSGIVSLKNGDAIDYKRRAASLVDVGAGGYFDNAVDPYPAFENAGIFLRTYGKANGDMYNVILGSAALNALLNNAIFKGRQSFFQLKLDAVAPPQRNATGFSLHGALSSGSYTFALWTYPEFYDIQNADGSITRGNTYWNPKKMVVLPQAPRFKTAFGLVPMLVDRPGQTPAQGEYVMGEFRDTRLAKHEFDIQSAPLVIPTSVDQIYTAKVVSG